MRIYSVNIFAELVDVEAAHIEIPISHQGIERPERKKSVAFFDARREHQMAIPNIMTKNRTITIQSIALRSIRFYFFMVSKISSQ